MKMLLPTPPAAGTAGSDWFAPTPPLAMHWAEWGFADPTGKDLGQGWVVRACPQCAADADTLVVHPARGPFVCVWCGHHGHAAHPPHRMPPTGLLDAPWWEPAPDALSAWGLPTPPSAGQGWPVPRTDADPRCWLWPARTPDGATGGIWAIRPDTGHVTLAAPWPVVPWGWDRRPDDQADLVVTDHPLDAEALWAVGIPAIAVPPLMHPDAPGGGDWSSLAAIEGSLRAIRRIVIAVRSDEHGRRLEAELARRLNRERCARTRWDAQTPVAPTRGALATRLVHGDATLRAAVADALPFPIDGIHNLRDVEDAFDTLWRDGFQPGLRAGWPSLDQHYSVKTGLWTLVHGIPGHGKSTLVHNIILRLAQRHQWRFGVFSPENLPVERFYTTLMEIGTDIPCASSPAQAVGPADMTRWKTWLDAHFHMIQPADDAVESWTIEGILDLARILVMRHGINGLVIDPYGELNGARAERGYTPAMARVVSEDLNALRRFLRLYGLHAWLVAHPDAPDRRQNGRLPVPSAYSLPGGAVWFNKADAIMAPYRHVAEEDQDIMDVHIQKVRFRDMGEPGLVHLSGSKWTKRLRDNVDPLRRQEALRNDETLPSAAFQVQDRSE